MYIGEEDTVMDVYGTPQPELFLVDDLFNFPNDEVFSPNSTTNSSTTTTTDSDLPLHHHYHYHDQDHHLQRHNPYTYDYTIPSDYLSDFTDKLAVPSEDVAELEWLSNFVDDSSSEFPITGAINLLPNTSPFHGRARTKRSRATTNATWTSSLESEATKPNNNDITRRRESSPADVERRCTHCSSEKTPQWRSGPLGPKTLCNACGVRYKSGRLVPEYRPASSPTFVLTQHSNSHRKVMELRRQKEVMEAAPPPATARRQEHHMYSQVC